MKGITFAFIQPAHNVVEIEMSDFDKAAFAKALSAVSDAGGPNPLGKASFAIAMDLEGIDVKTAVIILTDAEDMGIRPPASAMMPMERS